MSTHVLIVGDTNWADEIDLDFFKILTIDEWDKIKKETKEYFKDNGNAQVYIGTNEEVEFENYKAWLDVLTVTKIDEDEVKFLEKRFGTEFGAGNNIIDTIAEMYRDQNAGEGQDNV